MNFRERIAKLLLYGGIDKGAYQRVKTPVAESNHKALLHWSVLVCAFWLYCLGMSLRAEDYALCRPAYTAALSASILCYLFGRILVPRVPQALKPCMGLFRLSLLGGGIGIAMCQGQVRSLTMFAVAIMVPSIFIDNTLSSLLIHAVAIVGYIVFGKNAIAPDIYSWGLGNFILFSVFGLLIGNAINRERFERYFFADTAKELADIQTRYAYFDQMTGLKNRRAYAEKLRLLEAGMPQACCVVMLDINGLKQMNDTCGHTAGDELIVAASACLRAAFPGSEDIYRLGGDEFCVISEKDEGDVQSCLSVLERNAANWSGNFVRGVSLAIGMASKRDAAGIEEIVKQADDRMYAAKRRHYAETGNDRRKR